MKRLLSTTALALTLGLGAASIAPVQAEDPVPASTARHDRDGVTAPTTPLPVYGARSSGPIYSTPRITIATQQVVAPYVVAPAYQPVVVAPGYPSYVAAPSAPVVVTQPATTYAPQVTYVPRVVTQPVVTYVPRVVARTYVYPNPPMGAAEALRLADIAPAAGPEHDAAWAEFLRIDANRDGSISGDEYVYYTERFGRPTYWNY